MHNGESNFQTSYACSCLNVRLKCKRVDERPDLPSSPDWSPVYIDKEEEIRIKFPHLTLRTRKRAPYIPDPTKTARYISLTCLSCQTLVYRVHQAVSVHDEHNLKEGPIITKGWTETEVLRSTSGWVEVFKNVLNDEGIRKQENSAQFSPTFGIVISSASSTPAETITGRTITLEAVIKYQLPHIPPIFPEPRSTTSLFAALALLASQKSSELRSAAEAYIDEVAKKKIAEVQLAENQLKRDVQSLLNKYNEGIKNAETEQASVSESRPVVRQETPKSPRTESGPSGKPASVVHDFVPTTVSQTRRPRPESTTPRVSSLSASLATSSFHHPRAQQSSPPASSTSASLRSASTATLIAQPPMPDVGNVHRWGRNTDEQLDIATSYNYFLNLEDEMERRRKVLASSVPSPAIETSRKEVGTTSKQPPRELSADERENRTSEPPMSPKSKGKRRVTFDVKVSPVEPASGEEIVQGTDPGDMMFDFEDEDGQQGSGSRAVLPLVEQPPTRPPQPRKRPSGELPELLSSLRPSSLPNPSYLPARSVNSTTPAPEVDKDVRSPTNPPPNPTDLSQITPLPIPRRSPNGVNAAESSKSPKNPREEEILTKLAASMPSHRAAWRNHSETFNSFFSKEKTDDWVSDDIEVEDGATPEITGADHTQNGIPGSVPVPIHRPNVPPPRQELSLASYQAESAVLGNHRRTSSRSTVTPIPETQEPITDR